MPRFAGVVLAAGRSTRFGGVKQMEEFAGRPLVLHAVFAAQAAVLDPIIVTIGANADALADLLAREASFAIVVRLDDPEALHSDSLRAGLARVGPVEGAVILLADMPLVDAALIGAVTSAWREDDVALAPGYNGQRGHPVLLGAKAIALADMARGDQGLAPLLRDTLRIVPVNTGACLIDIDTRADLASARALGPGG
jgi:CTP:molybdopterin cytidylyltransferase MocA